MADTQSDKLTLEQVLWDCANNKDFVREYDRIRGTNVGLRQSPMSNEIDRTTGKWQSEVKAFFEFCTDAVWLRLPPEVRV